MKKYMIAEVADVILQHELEDGLWEATCSCKQWKFRGPTVEEAHAIHVAQAIVTEYNVDY